MKTLILILIIILICWLTYKYIRRTLKNKTEIITCYTGTLGSGKSLLSVQDALRLYKKAKARYKRRIIYGKLGIKKYKDWEKNKPPILLSTIPVKIARKKGINYYSTILTNEHLLLQEQVPQESILFIDEIGAYASQFEYKNPNILNAFNEFIRLFRHYVNGHIVCNEQASNFIELHIRSRINTIHNLSNCIVIWRFIFYYDRQINISEEKITTIDISQNNELNENDTQDNKNFKFRFMWYKKAYDSRAYKERYLKLFRKKQKEFNKLTTNRLLSIPKNRVVEPRTPDENGKVKDIFKKEKKGEKKNDS